MKSSLVKTLSLFLLFFTLLFVQIVYGQSLTRVKKFGKNPGHLKMYLHTPPKKDAQKNIPLVVVLHGCLQCPGNAARLTGWNKLADEHGFYLLYPGQRITNNPQKCFRWYRKRHISKNRGENYSIRNMIEYMKNNYPVDSTKVFVTGLSAGAAMGVVLMANYPETFNNGAIFAGGPYKAATSFVPAVLTFFGWRIKTADKWAQLVREQNPQYKGAYPKMIIYQGNNDKVVNKRNAVELSKQWSGLHHLSEQPTETIQRYMNNPDIERSSYRNEKSEEILTFYKVNKLGHALLVDPGKCKNQGGRHGFFSKDKGYHSTYRTAVDFGLIYEPEIAGKKLVNKSEQNITYFVPFHEQSTYSWTLPEGCKIISKDKSSITVTWGERAGNVNVVETDASGCSLHYSTLYVDLGK